MKTKLFFLLCAIPFLAYSQVYVKHSIEKDRLSIQLNEGFLNVIPLTEKTIRVQWERGIREERQFVLVNAVSAPSFRVSETSSQLRLNTKSVSVLFDKQTGAIDYTDLSGKMFLSEKRGSKKLEPSTINGEACFVAEQSFISPEDEYLFGLGQFQDGHYNLRNVTRKLIQVNSQIAIPFLYSSKGYGLMWHQYGLTHFNPADNDVALSKQSSDSPDKLAEVTTTSGTQTISQRQALYIGKFNIEREGEYSLMLDLGDMDNRHLVVIDGNSVIDQSNLWLPPAVSKIVKLAVGEHHVQVVCRSTNTPKLSWKLTANETTFRSPNARLMDYVVFIGGAEEVISSYRKLTGDAPMLPLWAYGFWQCRERYSSGEHLVKTVEEFRKRKLPVDVIVQDWQYWGKYGWGVPQFDETNYPNPDQFIKQLHDLNAHFSISVWENLDKKSEVAQDYISKNLYINNSPWIDIYNPETQKTHWNALNTNLFSKGVDSWWMDATEPENDALVGKQTFYGLGEFYRLSYPYFVSKAIYDGQRQTNPNKRVTILTRSAFLGQQRFGTINWSGDVNWDWDSYRRQFVSGLNYTMTGMPYWTTDIGGFFRPGKSQYTDEKYHDLLTRWFQWGTFSTIFRIHGYQSETEPWKYGDKVEANMKKMLNLRYKLMPYIYSTAWQVSKNGSTLMRPMIIDFSYDADAIKQSYQYMFGKSILVAPVTEPEILNWNVYLPKGSSWFEFWTGKKYDGGQTISTSAPVDVIPLYVKAGTILPIGPEVQYSTEKKWDNLELRIYPGANGKFILYEDENDNYNYEKGSYSTITFEWNDTRRTLTVSERNGSFPGMLPNRKFNIVMVDPNKGVGENAVTQPDKITIYEGKKVSIRL